MKEENTSYKITKKEFQAELSKLKDREIPKIQIVEHDGKKYVRIVTTAYNAESIDQFEIGYLIELLKKIQEEKE